MGDNVQRSRGRGQGYKFDRGGTPTEWGPFIGVVKQNIDPTRSGRLRVYIEQFGQGDPADQSLWRTVSYVPPFYGTTNPPVGPATGVGTFTGNLQSYGFWFTPPDIGTQVICFFVEGDPDQGYYIGCVPENRVYHMLPAIGASRKFVVDNAAQRSYLQGATQLPVTEINVDNKQIAEDPRFFDQTKPVHSVLAGVMFQQGLINDPIRGPITSNAQRESPSAVYGFSTPGKPIYQGGLNERDIKTQLERGDLDPTQVQVVARRGGHSFVMDDGDLEGNDTLVRIRTSKGHQITMSDNGDCFYITHANGQTWIELGKQGTVDVFSTNSVNVRTQGTINLHADREINMYSGGAINMRAKGVKIQADATLDLIGTGKLTAYSKNFVGVRSDGVLGLVSVSQGSWDAGKKMELKAGIINLNSGGGTVPVKPPSTFADVRLADTTFVPNQGWTVQFGSLPTIVTRAPTHEPYPYHNQGVSSITALSKPPATSLVESTSSTLASLSLLPVDSPINAAAFLSQSPAEISVGSLDVTQVTGLLAQTAQFVDQSFDEISLDKGIGKFGFTAEQLESGGFLKPGTVATYLSNPANLETVLNSPAVWTGKSGVENLAGLLVDPKLQDLTQNELMITSLNGLKSVGLVTGNESPQNLAAFVNTAAKYGVNSTIAWVQGKSPPDLVTEINQFAKSSQYAVNFVDTKLPDISRGVNLGGFTNTTERTSLDAALGQIIGNSKIPIPDFSSGLYSSTPNSDLIYTGTDPIVWERINAERLRRGLASLTAIGYPKPA